MSHLLEEALLEHLQGHTRHQLSYKPAYNSLVITILYDGTAANVGDQYLFIGFYPDSISTYTLPGPNDQIYGNHSWSYEDPALLDRLLEELKRWG